jgi:hypothetical protein
VHVTVWLNRPPFEEFHAAPHNVLAILGGGNRGTFRLSIGAGIKSKPRGNGVRDTHVTRALKRQGVFQETREFGIWWSDSNIASRSGRLSCEC